MQKDSTRDYITAAFRLYSAFGCPTEEEISNIAFMQGRMNGSYSIAATLDLIAVNKTLDILSNSGKDYICNAVKNIYFYEPRRNWHKGEINSRVVSFAVANYTDERNVWRWLKEARELCAHFRGLNTATIDQLIEN